MLLQDHQSKIKKGSLTSLSTQPKDPVGICFTVLDPPNLLSLDNRVSRPLFFKF